MSKIHFMYCPVTGLGLYDGFRGNRWLENRIRIFKQFVLPSLLNQSKKEFVLWMSFRPQEKKNRLVQELQRNLEGLRGFSVVFTFGGCCFWDDKHPHDKLLERLKRTLPNLKEWVGEAEYVYMTIQPSDDLYIGSAVETIQSHPYKHRKAVGWKRGYIMNYATKEVADYNPDTTPPFYTIIFPKEVFLDPERHFEYIGPYRSHEFVNEIFNFVSLEGRGFVVGCHGENISTTFNHPYRGRFLTADERDAILIKTGTYFSDPVIIRKGYRLLARQILNALPLQEPIRRFYHRLPEVFKIF